MMSTRRDKSFCVHLLVANWSSLYGCSYISSRAFIYSFTGHSSPFCKPRSSHYRKIHTFFTFLVTVRLPVQELCQRCSLPPCMGLLVKTNARSKCSLMWHLNIREPSSKPIETHFVQILRTHKIPAQRAEKLIRVLDQIMI